MDGDSPRYKHDAFISYSRKDLAFAKALEAKLESFRTPRGLQIAEHNLEIFRDESDFTGTAYYNSIEGYLEQSATLIVICSPDAAVSGYVNDEIRRFVNIRHGNERKIIPILYRGVPNNEAGPGQEQERAFPAALCEVLGMPLAINYLGFDFSKHKMNRGAYFNAWYGLLANICGVSRAQIEERDRQRQTRQRRFQAAVVSAVFVALLVALVITLVSRGQAVDERKMAVQRQHEAEMAAEAERIARKDEESQRRVAEQQKALAEAQRNIATQAQRTAEAGELSVNAVNAMSEDPQLGLLLSIEAAMRSYSASRTISTEAQGALHNALLTQRERLELFVHQGFVYSVAFSPDRRLLATSDSSEVKLWDPVSGARLATHFTGAGAVLSLSFSPDGTKLATGGKDKTARLWDVKSGRELVVFNGHKGLVWSVAFSPDGTRLATASRDSTVRLWSVATGRELKTLTGHTGDVSTVAFNHNGSLLASGDGDNSTRIWDVESGRQLNVMPGGGNSGSMVRGVAFSPDDRRLATVNSGSADVKIWDVTSGREVSTFRGHTGSVFAVAYSPDGSQLATTSLDKTARLWDTASGKELMVFTGHTGSVICLAFSADGAHLATGAEDGTARIWEVEQPNEFPPLVGHTGSVKDVVFSRDGGRIASASADGTVRIWKANTGDEVMTLRPAGAVNGVAFSPDGRRIATATSERDVKIFDASTGAQLLTLSGHSAPVTSVSYSRDGRHLATGSTDNTARVWNASNGREEVKMRTSTGKIECVDLNRSGTRVALAFYDERGTNAAGAQIWDVPSKRNLVNFDGDYVWVHHVQFNPDGTRLVTTGSTPPFLTKIWDSQSGRNLFTLAGHTAAVLTAAFSPDGQSLATGGEDSTIRLWDVRDGRELLRLASLKANIESVAFSPDGKQLVSGGSDGIVRLYAIDPMELMALAASRLARGLTTDECRKYLRRSDCSAAASSKLFAAKQWMQKGETAAATKTLSNVLGDNQADSSESVARLLLSQLGMSEGHERAETGDFTGAAAAFRASLSLQSRSQVRPEQETTSLITMAQVRNAKRLEASGRWTDAIAVLQQTVMLDPKNEEAYAELDRCFNKTEQYDKAVDAMRHVVQLRPSASNLTTFADSLRLNKQYPEAAAQAKKAIGLDPNKERAHRILGLIYVANKDSNNAIEEFQAAIAISPTVFAYDELANIYESRKDFGQALENIKKGKALDKTYIPLYQDAESIYHEDLGDFGAAYRELSEAHGVAPENAGIAADLAEACLTDGRFREATDMVDKLLGSKVPSPDLSSSDQVALKFIRIAALSLDGQADEANAARQEFMSYLTALGQFKQSWDYAGTKRFLAEYKMDQDLRLELQKLLASIEVRNISGR